MGSDDLFKRRKQKPNADLNRNKSNREGRLRYLIVCEGEKTEPNYLVDLRNDLKISSALIQIEKNQNGSSPNKVFERAVEVSEIAKREGIPFDRVYCVFDKDKHETFDSTKLQISNYKKTPIKAIISVPCFEVWILLHFSYSTSPFVSTGKKSVGDSVVNKLKQINGFEKYEKGMKEIYLKTKPLINTAINNANKLRNYNCENDTDNPSTDMDELIKDIQTNK